MSQEKTPSAPDEKTMTPKWQKHLEGVHVPRKGLRLKGTEGEKTRKAVLSAYADGARLREIASFLGRSYGSVHDIVSDAEILRPRGGANETAPGLLPPQERAEKTLRDLIASEAYKPGHKLPPLAHLTRAAGVTRKTLAQVALKLQTENRLLLVPGRGYVVIDPSNPPKGDTLQVCIWPGWWETWLIGNQDVTNADYLKKIIMEQIREGSLAPGSRVPSQATISRRFGTPVSAVQSALRSLEKRGHLVRRKRSLFVPDPPSHSPSAQGVPPRRTGTALSPLPTAEQS